MKKDTRTRFTLRLPDKLFNMLECQATEIGVSVNALILQILWEWEKNKKENRPA